ncbi:MAG: type II secretory protein PulC [Sphingomonas sp.]|nr:type II secretory protein PulC [Sphingomonas sp.]
MLRRVPLARLYIAIEILLLALLAWQGARLVWTVITPVDPVGSWKVRAPGMADRASGLLHGFDPFFRLDAATPGAAPAEVVTSLQLTLFGTRLDAATGRGAAIIAGPDGEQKSYSVGEEITPGATLKAVAFDRVTIERGGKEEVLAIDQASGGTAPTVPGAPPATSPASGAAPAASVDPSGVTFAQLRAEVGFIPRIDGGKVSGLVVRPQGSGAAFRKIGLKEGDVVTQIGGRPVTGPGDIEALSGQFAKGGTLSVTVERGADVLPLTLNVAGQ